MEEEPTGDTLYNQVEKVMQGHITAWISAFVVFSFIEPSIRDEFMAQGEGGAALWLQLLLAIPATGIYVFGAVLLAFIVGFVTSIIHVKLKYFFRKTKYLALKYAIAGIVVYIFALFYMGII